MSDAPGPALTFLGHSTVLVELDGIRILTDPVLRDRVGPLRRQAAPPHADVYDGIDAVVISHVHHDHLDLASLRHLRGRPLIIVPKGAASLMRQHGFHEVVELGSGERHEVGGVAIEATPAFHGGFRAPFGPTAASLGYVIGDRNRRVYFAGDTELFSGMADIHDINIALLPVWGWGPTLGGGHMNPERAAEALRLLRPRAAVPIHWGTLWPRGLRARRDLLVEPPRRFVAAAAELAPDVVIAPTDPGAHVDLAG